MAVAFGLAVGASLALAAQTVPPPLDDKEALLVTVYIGRTPLQELMATIPARGTFFVPFGELCSRLGFGIRVHPLQGTAEGFFISTQRTFKLIPESGQALVEKRPIPFMRNQIERLNGELYVDVELLSKWFPMEVELEAKGSALLLTPKEKLPIQLQWERDGKYASLGNKLGAKASEPGSLPGVSLHDPYRFAEIPMLDLALNANHYSTTGKNTWSGALSGGGDLLWMSGLGMLNRDSNGHFTNSRLSLFREEPTGIGGVMGLRHINLGDLNTTPALDIVGSLPMGRGLLLDNYPISYRSAFASRSFRGMLPEGWSVELYQNGALLGFRRSGGNGSFEFTDIPLRYGLNQFRLIFLGPLGERREETYRYDISNELPAPGQLFYRVAGVRSNTNCPSSATATPSGGPASEPPDHTVDVMGELEFGLSRWLAVRTGYLQTEANGNRKDFGVAGFTAMMPYLVTRLSVASENDRTQNPQNAQKGSALEGQILTGFDYATFSARRSEYRHGFQPLQGAGYGGGLMKSQSEYLAQVPTDTLSIPFNIAMSRRDYTGQNGKGASLDSLILSQSYRKLNVSAGISRETGGDKANEGLRANAMVSTYVSSYSFQGNLSYGKTGGQYKFQDYSALADYRDSRDILYRLQISGNIAAKQAPSVILSANKMLGRFAFGLTGQYSKGRGSSIGVNLGLSTGREPRTGKWVTNAQQLSGSGALSLQAFQDGNGNGRLDPGERVIEEAQFKVSGGTLPNQIRDPKTTFFTGVGRSQELRVELDETSLPDASLHTGLPAYRILPRTGHVQKIDFPVVLLGEVNGTTRLRREGQKAQDLGGLEIEVVRKDGSLVQRIRSAYDGFFEFLKLVPGDYVLKVSDEEIRRLGLVNPPRRPFTIDAKRNLLDGLDLVVDAPRADDGTKAEIHTNPTPAPTEGRNP